MTTPRLGAPELVSGQATPETTVNEQIRYIESGAGHFIFKDRDLATPPGSPADGDCYLVAASPTGTWAGHAGDVAFRVNTAWAFIEVIEGMTAWVNDEDVLIGFDGSAWNVLAAPSGSVLTVANNLSDLADAATSRNNLGIANLGTALPLTFNFTDTGEARFYADEAMTLTEQATSGTGTIAYEKSTNAAPSTFSSTTSPITLESGAWLKVSASSVTSIVAVHLKRTA